MIETALRWIGHTGLGVLMRDSTWAFAVVETIHLLGLATLGGAVLATNLSAGRLLFRRNDAATIAQAAAPVLKIALAVMIASGALLVSAKPIRYYLDDMFRAKMALLVLAILSSLAVRHLLARQTPPSAAARVAALASLALWLGVGVAGRIIGFL
jgi:uncharacterized membrane protein